MEEEEARRHLVDERTRLEGVVASLASDHLADEPEEEASGELAHFDQHPADAASDAFEREKELSILEQVEAELAAVDRALARLREGRYGICDACGTEIPDERLEAMPAARFCRDHQAEAEI